MQYEDIVYKAGILAMAVRLEGFLVAEWEKKTGNNFHEKRRELSKGNKSYGEFLVKEFLEAWETTDKKSTKQLKKSMDALFHKRNKIAHPSNYAVCESDFRERDFRDVREICMKMDVALKELNEPLPTSPLPRMGEVMVSCSLRYDMGNAGDIVKHGVLAEFAEWWGDGQLRFADPFGGRPWGIAKKEVRARLQLLPDCALLRAQQLNNPQARDGIGLEKYYGSSHVVLNAAGKLAEVFASDSDKLAGNDLRASSLKLIEDKIRGYDSQDGYSILDPECAENFNLILVDPYADFLRDELDVRVHGREEDRRFHKIKEAVERGGNENLWVAVFVLMKGRQVRAYEKLRESYFKEDFIALRCLRFPRRKKFPAGESSYHMEILLVSKRLADNAPRIKTLRKKIAKFKVAAERALGEGKIQAWGVDEDKS